MGNMNRDFHASYMHLDRYKQFPIIRLRLRHLQEKSLIDTYL
jgi:hypothetical protein